jgi:vacuolar protein sorting-associated protein 13A/C
VNISDVKLHLTQTQYGLLIALSRSIPRVLATSGSKIQNDQVYAQAQQVEKPQATGAAVDLRPEVQNVNAIVGSWTTLDLVVNLDVVKLHLYGELASSEQSLKDHGITRLALNSCTLRSKMLSDGAIEAEVVLKSFTMSDTRPGHTKFREIIPAAQHNRSQVMVLYTSAGGPDSSAMVVMTVDSPQVIFSVEPIIGLLEFFTSAFNGDSIEVAQEAQANLNAQPANETVLQSSTTLNFRLDLHDVSVSVLEDNTDINSRAIRLAIRKILLSQQVGSS